MTTINLKVALVIPVFLFASFAAADIPVQSVDYSKSYIIAIARQVGVPVEGTFKKFSAKIKFDPAKLSDSKAEIEIDTATYDLGDDDFNKEVRKKDWFSTTAFPKANFVTTSVKSDGKDHYVANGKLTIKGKTADVVAPISVKTEGGNTIYEGTVPIKRLQFNIGDGDWKDTSTVADEVQIKFHIVVAKK